MAEQPPNDAESPRELFEPGADRAAYVQQMFGDIAGRYDRMNTLMTGGRHHAWRRLAARSLVRPGDRVIDVGCGTGDLSLACARAGAASVLGVDFAAPMLERARTKAARSKLRGLDFAVADATRLPLRDGQADVWCAAFVVRNIPDLDAAFGEARRVLRPRGRLGILEIPRMKPSPLRPLARVHFQHVVPRLGRLISGHPSAYRYLPVSVDQFLTPEELADRLEGTGFRVRRVRSLMLGTIALHLAERA